MKLYRLAFALSAISVAILTACSSTENKATESTPEKSAAAAQPPSKEPVLYTGLEAFNRLLGLAFMWSPDAQPARLESVLTTEATGQGGKSTVWRGFFASPSRRSVKTIVCSGSRRPDAPPFFVVQGAQDTLVWPEDARAFVDALCKASTKPVGYAEIPFAQHAFDLMTTRRNVYTVRAITRFLDHAHTGR